MTKLVKYKSMKRGDTPVFSCTFRQPYEGFNWSDVTCDFVMTNVVAPTDNSGAAIYQQNVTKSVDLDNSARFSVQPTIVQSKALLVGKEYKIEWQLKQGTSNVTTPLTGTIVVEQDYVI